MRLQFHIILESVEDINFIRTFASSFSILALMQYSLVSDLREEQFFFVHISYLHVVSTADSILVFFRAYRDKDGRIIFSHRSIALRYIKSGWFFVNLLASTPTVLILYIDYKQEYLVESLHSSGVRFYFFLGLFKLFRLYGLNGRIKHLMDTSEFVSGLWVKINIMTAKMFEFLLVIILLTHWLGCIWGFIAFVEVGSFEKELMLSTPNWMGNWQKINTVPGGLYDLGWENTTGRYWLCMFWASQTITSIGYGDILPVTTAEYALANFLMLSSGIFWAYVTAVIVEIVTNANKLNRDSIQRWNDASQMVCDFAAQNLPEKMTGTTAGVKASKRVRLFLTDERDHCTRNTLDEKNALTLSEAYPTLDVLSPELRKVCALHLTHTYLETIPYLSSKYLSTDDQAEIALQCRTLEFAAGEHFSSHPEFGRGLLIFKYGLAFTSRTLLKTNLSWPRALGGHAAEVNEVLIEDDYCKEQQLVYHFVSYTKVLFVPRSAIINMLKKNPAAWKESARWRYFRAALILFSLKDDELEVV